METKVHDDKVLELYLNGKKAYPGGASVQGPLSIPYTENTLPLSSKKSGQGQGGFPNPYSGNVPKKQ